MNSHNKLRNFLPNQKWTQGNRYIFNKINGHYLKGLLNLLFFVISCHRFWAIFCIYININQLKAGKCLQSILYFQCITKFHFLISHFIKIKIISEHYLLLSASPQNSHLMSTKSLISSKIMKPKVIFLSLHVKQINLFSFILLSFQLS